MATDPKKNDEVKDEELEKVSGGGDAVDEQLDDDIIPHGDTLAGPTRRKDQRTME